MRITVRTLVAVLAMVLIDASPRAQRNATVEQLVEQFLGATEFWQQFETAKELAKVGDAWVLKALAPLLAQEDRHVRANAAFVFTRLGDPRGLETLHAIVEDRSDRPLGQGIAGGSFNMDAARWWLSSQIHADRYYAVHVLAESKDNQAVEWLIPLLSDGEINYQVAWALGQIGDRRAIGPLINALQDRDALVRVSAIQGLEALDAREALPQLRGLLNDQAPGAGDRVPVRDVAKAAIAKIEKAP